MSDNFINLAKLTCCLLLISGCDLLDRVEERARVLNNFEKVAISLEKENRELRGRITELKFELNTLRAKNDYLTIKADKNSGPSRGIASLAPPDDVKEDLVQFHVYRWPAVKMLQIADQEFNKKNYEKAAQFFRAVIRHYPSNRNIDDQLLFQLGVASYESGDHYDWSAKYLGNLVRDYPTSKYYRGAKLWVALSNHKMGKNKDFFKTVEEFRLNYRNTVEWKILKSHYETIRHKYKN